MYDSKYDSSEESEDQFCGVSRRGYVGPWPSASSRIHVGSNEKKMAGGNEVGYVESLPRPSLRNTYNYDEFEAEEYDNIRRRENTTPVQSAPPRHNAEATAEAGTNAQIEGQARKIAELEARLEQFTIKYDAALQELIQEHCWSGAAAARPYFSNAPQSDRSDLDFPGEFIPYRSSYIPYYQRMCTYCHKLCNDDEYHDHTVNHVCRPPHAGDRMRLPPPRPSNRATDSVSEVSLTCLHCSRKFLPSAWSRHVEVCESVFGTKRPVLRKAKDKAPAAVHKSNFRRQRAELLEGVKKRREELRLREGANPATAAPAGPAHTVAYRARVTLTMTDEPQPLNTAGVVPDAVPTAVNSPAPRALVPAVVPAGRSAATPHAFAVSDTHSSLSVTASDTAPAPGPGAAHAAGGLPEVHPAREGTALTATERDAALEAHFQVLRSEHPELVASSIEAEELPTCRGLVMERWGQLLMQQEIARVLAQALETKCQAGHSATAAAAAAAVPVPGSGPSPGQDSGGSA